MTIKVNIRIDSALMTGDPITVSPANEPGISNAIKVIIGDEEAIVHLDDLKAVVESLDTIMQTNAWGG